MGVFDDLTIDHVGIAVTDLVAAAEWWTTRYGFAVLRPAAPDDDGTGSRSTDIGSARFTLRLTEAEGLDHPAAAYLEQHGEGVYDIALGVPDARQAFAEAVRRGAQPVRTPRDGADGDVTASIIAFGDVLHTFVERPGDPRPAAPAGEGLHTIDHFAVCVEPGRLEPTTEFYVDVLDFEAVFTEHIVVGRQAMNSIVVRSRSKLVTLTVLEPDLTRDPGQIDQFLKDHDGAGVQHVAFATDGIVAEVARLSERGVEFLSTPAAYYDQVPDRLELRRYSVEDLRGLNILVDQDHNGQLLQIFARSVHPRGTLFFEVVERLGAQTFGSGNIHALYSAVELERARNG
ncbi:4-hydroxyphenylpyruvate dioxygenase [Actinacidiphila acididurans]|uniref:4-hydroxyphenylpyruvate dioxygenase n=1 Tax=Actinacidiphila acididurans TaxID=2784346 RepID=A0ABS2U2V9_9ACTN|nr:4-hydroxyphenylpyruvate dioxygenase [Actinacidiphila acididurans]MBM9509916.1 4-hydroxyphenylpyruvate dioxygenase [Actinacidiphila acididurans]